MSASSQDNDQQGRRRATGTGESAGGRDARLKAALKANMARRKAQARARAGLQEAAPGQGGADRHDGQSDRAGHDPAGNEGDKRHE